MNDSQRGTFWYLHLTKDGGCTVVYAEPAYADDDGLGSVALDVMGFVRRCASAAINGQTLDEEREREPVESYMKLGEVASCAASFEEFVHRFWMENTLWFALYEKTASAYTPLTPEQEAYLDAVRKARDDSGASTS